MRGFNAIVGFFVGVGLTAFIAIIIAPVLLAIRSCGTPDIVAVLSSRVICPELAHQQVPGLGRCFGVFAVATLVGELESLYDISKYLLVAVHDQHVGFQP